MIGAASAAAANRPGPPRRAPAITRIAGNRAKTAQPRRNPRKGVESPKPKSGVPPPKEKQ